MKCGGTGEEEKGDGKSETQEKKLVSACRRFCTLAGSFLL